VITVKFCEEIVFDAETMTIHLEMDFTTVSPLDETMDLHPEIMVCFKTNIFLV